MPTDERAYYLITRGAYSDYEVFAVLTGPRGADLGALWRECGAPPSDWWKGREGDYERARREYNEKMEAMAKRFGCGVYEVEKVFVSFLLGKGFERVRYAEANIDADGCTVSPERGDAE